MLLKHFVEYSDIKMFFPVAYLMRTEQQQERHLMKSAVLTKVMMKSLIKEFYKILRHRFLI